MAYPGTGQRVIMRFEGAFAFLSSFYEYPVVFEGTLWPTREHAYQAAKSRDPAYRERLVSSATPGQAKRAGRMAKLVANWDTHIRVPVMCSLVTAQFNDPLLRSWLLATQDCLLIEGNHWHDNFWGDCECGRHARSLGETCWAGC